MSRAYVLGADLATLGLIDQSYARITYTRRLYALDTFELTINRKRLYASELQVGRFLYLPDEGDLMFLIEQIETDQSGDRSQDTMIVVGRSLEGPAMAERIVVPGSGDAYDEQTSVAAETAIKHYVEAHAVDAADPDRNIPGLVIAPDQARGSTVNAAGRFQTVLEICARLGTLAGMGWEIKFDPVEGEFVFEVLPGTDRSASVFFDFAFDTLEKWTEVVSELDVKTWALVAGQGEGVDRELVTRGGGVGLERREAFLDARDVEQGNTTLLQSRGDEFLAAVESSVALDATIHQFGSFRYREHWDLGDIVTVRNEERGLEYASRVVEVEVTVAESPVAPVVVATLGRPIPSLQDRASTGSTSTADTGGGGSGTPAGPAGGDLSGTYPDPTVQDDSHNHTGSTVTTTDAPSGANVTLDAAPSAGSGTAIARATHGHRLNTYSSTPAADTLAGSAGTSGTAPARGNHSHPKAGPVRRVYTSGTTWNKPAGLSHIEVECLGPGGAGGGAPSTGSGQASTGGGGGAGGYARKLFLAAALPSSCTVTVGTGGSPGSAGNDGGNGSAATTFAGTGITTVSGGAGGGGQAGSATSGNNLSTAGSGGAASGGDINATGGNGIRGVAIAGGRGSMPKGADSIWGSGGQGNSNSNGGAASGYGAGGGGGTNGATQSANQGGAGADGLCVVTEYYF